MEANIIKINRYNAHELNEYLEAYLLLKTGSILTPFSIAKGLEEYFNVKTSHVTVDKYLKEIFTTIEEPNNNYFLMLNREYVKPYYRKTDSMKLDFGCVYYLLDDSQFDRIYGNLKSYCGEKNNSIPSKNQLKKRLFVFGALLEKFGVINSGVLIYYFNDVDSCMVKKKAFPLDFIASTNGKKCLFLLTDKSQVFDTRNKKYCELYKQAIYSIRKVKNNAVYIINLMDKEIENQGLIEEFNDKKIEIVNYKDIYKMDF